MVGGRMHGVLAVVFALCVSSQPAALPAGRRSLFNDTLVRLGGSLGLTGELSAMSRASRQGIELLAERVNATRVFKSPWGYLRLELQIEDDAGDSLRVEEIYKRMAALGQVDFFLGPYSSPLAMVAAQISNATGILTMMFGAASPSLYEQGYHTVFTTDVLAPDYMTHALEVSKFMGANTVALVFEANTFDKAVCGGAAEHARRLGLTVLSELQLDEEGMTSQVRNLKAHGPDVFVGCGQLRTAVQIVVSARALSFNPQAMILMIGSARAFVHSVGASNANYIMSPVSWVPYMNLSCPVFGSTQGFVDAYYERWGEAPTHQSAAAASGGIALLAAIEAAGTMETEAVRAAMLDLDIETFYARLSFHRNGTRRGATVLTEQVQPLDADRPPVERYMESKVVSVGPYSPPLWPMPAWDQKEIEVYPCPPGEAWRPRMNETGQEVVTCERCPAGRYRHPRSVICEECEAGQYGAEEGMSQCEVCPRGADCPAGFRPGRPNATAGYYQMPLGELMMVECSPGELCLGANNCSGHNAGILCAQCEPGYARMGFGVSRRSCTSCSSFSWSVFTIVLTVVLYTLYIWIIVKATLSASTSIRAIHSVILKICVNYLQFAGTAFEATEFKSMVVSIYGSRAEYLVPLVSLPEFIQYPFAGMVSLDCLLSNYGIRWYEACIMVGLFLMPVAFLLKTLFAFVRKDFLMKRWSRRSRRQRRQIHGRHQTRSAEDACSPGPEGPKCDKVVVTEPPEPTSPFSRTTGTPPRRAPGTPCRRMPSTPASHAAASSSGLIQEAATPGAAPPGLRGPPSGLARGGGGGTPVHGSGMLQLPYRLPSGRSLQFGAPSPLHRTSEMMTAVANSSIVTRFVNSSVVMSFVLHPVVVRLLVVGFECVDLDVLRQKHDLDVTCKSEEHKQWLIWSITGLLLFGFGTPLALLLMLCRHRHQLLQDDVCKRFGFLYNGFEQCYWFVEPFYMWRKVFLLLFFTFPTMYLRTVLMLFISWVFILVHTRYQPFDNRSFLCLDRLEAMNLRALTVTVTARLVFDIREELSGHFFDEMVKHWTVDALLVLMPLAFHLWFWIFAVWSLLRNTVMKHLSLKADVWPERLTRAQRVLLWLERRKNKASWSYDGGHLRIDTSKLSAKEQSYLFVALRDTLHRFMDSKREVHLGLVADTVREAIRECRSLRRSKAARIEQLHRQEAERPSCWRTLLRWRGELRLSLHGPTRVEEEEEGSCCSVFCAWLEDMAYMLEHGHGQPDAARRATAERSPYSDACARGTENEFTVEELYDALMPLWQDINEREPRASAVPEEEPRLRAIGQSRTVCELLMGQADSQEGVQEQASESSKDTEDDQEGKRPKVTPRLGSFNKVEFLLGRSPSAQPDEAGNQDSDASMIQQASQPCHIELPTLLRQHDKLLTENLQLRSENETLRRRVTTAAWAPSLVAQARKAAMHSPTLEDLEVQASRQAAAQAAAEAPAPRSPSPHAQTETSEVPSTASPTSTRPASVAADEPAEVGPADAAGAPPRSPAAAAGPEGPGGTAPAGGEAPGQGAGGPPERAALEPGPGAAAPAAPAAGAGPGAAARVPAITLPGVEKRRLRPGSPRSTLSGSSFGCEAHRPPRGPAAGAGMSAWSGAMRPTDPGAWPRVRPFEFMRAARPTSPGAWPKMRSAV